MDLPYIKKEEPVDYALVLTDNSQTDIADDNLQEIYTITFKDEPYEEPTKKDTFKSDNIAHRTDDYCKDSEGSNFSENFDETETSDEDYVDDGKKSTKKMKNSSKCEPDKKFMCPKCPAVYKRNDVMKKHLQKHANDTKVECPKCHKFIPKSYIDCHLLIHDGPPFICTVCNKGFNRKDCFRGHRKVHWEKKFECHHCHKLFITKSLLASHLETHIEREKTFQCQVCPTAFYRKNSLQRHVRFAHSDAPRKKFKCTNPICQREYSRNDEFKKHKCRERIANVKCSHCKMRFYHKSERAVHFAQSHSKQCEQCGVWLRDYHKLVLHSAQNCSDSIAYDCDLCPVKIVGKRKLITHFANCHQTYECNYCCRVFQSAGLRSIHMKKHCTVRSDVIKYHTSDTTIDSSKRFECDICGLLCMQKHGIVEHMKIMHSMKSLAGAYFAEKFTCFTNRAVLHSYPCCDEQYEGKVFSRKHTITDKCKFYCKRCKSTYANFYWMYRHIAEHTTKVHQSIRHMEKCKGCDRRFKWKLSVPEHLK